MLFFKTHKGQVVLNFILAFLLRCNLCSNDENPSLEGADEAIMVGLIAEAIVFL
jgi:hypothetical protein